MRLTCFQQFWNISSPHLIVAATKLPVMNNTRSQHSAVQASSLKERCVDCRGVESELESPRVRILARCHASPFWGLTRGTVTPLIVIGINVLWLRYSTDIWHLAAQYMLNYHCRPASASPIKRPLNCPGCTTAGKCCGRDEAGNSLWSQSVHLVDCLEAAVVGFNTSHCQHGPCEVTAADLLPLYCGWSERVA